MFYQAKNGKIPIAGTEMDYIAFGTGSRHMIMLPGLGEGLQTIGGTAIPFAVMYRMYAKKFRVTVFGRRKVLPKTFSTREMAQDLHFAMQHLGIEKASIVGISMGGMIAQWLAIDHPESVEKLALVVTAPEPNDTLTGCVTRWIGMAEKGDHKALMLDTAVKMYSDAYMRKNRWMFGILGNVGRPKSYDRFFTMANACLTHDAFTHLETITAPSLVIGGKRDLTLTGEASEKIAEKIPGAQLYLYDDYGHALYEEAEDFNERLLRFLD